MHFTKMEDKLNWGANDQQITKKKNYKKYQGSYLPDVPFPKNLFSDYWNQNLTVNLVHSLMELGDMFKIDSYLGHNHPST